MIVAVGVAYTVVSVAAEAALNAVQIGEGGTILFRQASKYVKVDDPDMPLHKRVRRIVALRVFELVIWFLLLNLVGVFVARYFVRNTDIENQQWDWMTTLYWAVQTTTTIGALSLLGSNLSRATRHPILCLASTHIWHFLLYRIW